ncbi:MAG: precorrin-6y C5,15-methyltransferase (decarboxylating) subunit CbiE [Deltaproteobacteria bacterium]|nr:precorrin-6y C5,15-methyltransferase (decarboxylating) subunit CbiE [Deltaproteobacteria bacterium]
MNPIDIIGIGQGKKDLTRKHLEIIQNCDVLVGGKRHLEIFDSLQKEKITIKGPIKNIVDIVKRKMSTRKIVVLASGDPLFHGIGSTFTKYFEKQHLRIHSNISSVSAAFAAIKEPWHDAKIISLHEKQTKNFSFSNLAGENKIVFLTGPESGPGFIASELIKEGMYDFNVCVLEKLGSKDQRTTWFENIDLIGKKSFLQPNIVILIKHGKIKPQVSYETYAGMDDSLFKHSKGLITKSEVRSITLSKLKLVKNDHVLWDIGSGSGSIGIEASFQVPRGRVFAIEKHPGRIEDIVHNIKKFNCSNVRVLNIAFPEGVDELKTPDRIFIGGGGENLEQIIKVSCARLAPSGIIVINTILLQNLNIALKRLKEYKFNPRVVQIQVSRSKGMPFGDRLEALNPVWIITGSKTENRNPL